MVKYICLREKGVYLKSKLQNTETWSSPAWPPCRLCYRPVVFFRHLRLTALSFSQETNFRGRLEKCYYLNIFNFQACLWNCEMRILASSCLSLCLLDCPSVRLSAPIERIFMTFHICGFFENLSTEFTFD